MVTKRRFFARNGPSKKLKSEPEPEPHNTITLSPSPPSRSIENSLFVPDNDIESDEEAEYQTRPEESTAVSRISTISPPTVSNKSIQQELFETQITSIVGHVSLKHLNYLYNKHHTTNNATNSVKNAINEYLSGIKPSDIEEFHASHANKSDSTQSNNSISVFKHPISFNSQALKAQTHIKSESTSSSMTKKKYESIQQPTWRRFIGSLDVQAWATRPTLRPLTYQQTLQLKRLVPKNSTILNSSIIRIFLNDREIGRIPEDLTRILSPLIDFNLIAFEITVLESTTRRLSIGDSFLIHIDVYLNSLAFDNSEDEINIGHRVSQSLSLPPPSKKGRFNNFNFSTESKNESILRLRQFAISKLFDKLNIRPLKATSSNTTNMESIDSQFEVIDELTSINLDSDGEEDENDEVKELDSDNQHEADEVNLDQLKQFYQQNNESNLLNSLPDTTTPPTTNFKMDLRPYQKVGLSWMILREGEPSILKRLSNDEYSDVDIDENSQEPDHGIMNPLWRKFKWPKNIEDRPNNNDQFDLIPYFYANLYNGELSLDKPIIKTTKNGGILADEMGLGKTISTLSLINSIPYDTSNEVPQFSSSQDQPSNANKPYASKTTLIVVPMSLLTQWKNEFEKANNNPNHYCLIYYGNNNSNLINTLIHHSPNKIPIVILTTYGTIQNEYIKLKSNKSQINDSKLGIYSVNYFRIILDEGHNIRNRNTKTAKSIYELFSKKKWILTGTPIINKLDDLYSLVKFLKLEPWSNFSYWKTFITLPFEQKQFSQALDIIKSILDPILLRRTKDMKQADGKPLIELPEKEIVIEEIKFNQTELKLYNWLKTRANKSFKEGLKSGQILRQYTQILTHILRLRQVCCHMDLVGGPSEMDEEEQQQKEQEQKLFVQDDEAEGDEDTKKFLSGVKQDQELQQRADYFANDTEVRETMYKLYAKVDLVDSECSICTTSPISLGEMVVTPCGHLFCLTCLIEHIEFQSANLNVNTNGHDSLCPNCRFSISKYKLFRLRNNKTVTSKDIKFHTRSENHDIKDPSKDYSFQLYLYNPDKVSSKIQALFNHLKVLKEQSPQEKVIIFSQFSSYLDIIESELKLQLGEFEFKILKFDGRLSMQDREKVLIKFNEPALDKFTILLLSLKSGGVGLNLTQASRAYMMDPWWSPSIEDQAIDRIHRIGQNKTVKVVRFIMENSIEIKMLKIQERKKQIGEAVGVEEEERRKRRIEEIKILFEE